MYAPRARFAGGIRDRDELYVAGVPRMPLQEEVIGVPYGKIVVEDEYPAVVYPDHDLCGAHTRTTLSHTTDIHVFDGRVLPRSHMWM